MYIIGNAQTARHVPMWEQVIDMLKSTDSIGQTLPLCCPRHPDTTIHVSTPDDFSRLAPEGGCNLPCSLRLRCGHSCINKCHSRLLHDTVICQEPCPRSVRGCDHFCPKLCGQACDPLCEVVVGDIILPCGHTAQQLRCYEAQVPRTVSCKEKVTKEVPGCGHIIKVYCGVDVSTPDFLCNSRCGAYLLCGHQCLDFCHNCRVRSDGEVTTTEHGKCLSVCKRPYSTCTHECPSLCHGEDPCPLCDKPCEVQCSHSRCDKPCREPCAPCAEECDWSCPHREAKCHMPCAVPCDMLPCSERCKEFLSCGHQCPTICGEKCPSEKFCQQCASDAVKDQCVDYIEGLTYAEVDLNLAPCVIPPCGHILTLESMDGHMDFSNHYTATADGTLIAPTSISRPFAMESLKRCPMCRASLTDLKRYSRIIKRATLDNMTKKFIAWTRARIVHFEDLLHEQESELQDSFDEFFEQVFLHYSSDIDTRPADDGATPGQLRLAGPAHDLIKVVLGLQGLTSRYEAIGKLRDDVWKFRARVSEAEQPFMRVHDMVENLRRRRGIHAQFAYDADVLQVGTRLLATSLALRCDLNILADFANIYRSCRNKLNSVGPPQWAFGTLEMDLSRIRADCASQREEAHRRRHLMEMVEACVLFSEFVLVERVGWFSGSLRWNDLRAFALTQLEQARRICSFTPSTQEILPELEDAYTALQESSFYRPVSNAERRTIYAAIGGPISGEVHWYYCTNHHLVSQSPNGRQQGA